MSILFSEHCICFFFKRKSAEGVIYTLKAIPAGYLLFEAKAANLSPTALRATRPWGLGCGA